MRRTFPILHDIILLFLPLMPQEAALQMRVRCDLGVDPRTGIEGVHGDGVSVGVIADHHLKVYQISTKLNAKP